MLSLYLWNVNNLQGQTRHQVYFNKDVGLFCVFFFSFWLKTIKSPWDATSKQEDALESNVTLCEKWKPQTFQTVTIILDAEKKDEEAMEER